MSPEDREVMDKTLAIVRALSVSLIGRANGETYDEDGGRMGRLEKEVKDLGVWRNWMMTSLITLLLSVAAYFIKAYIEKHP